MSSRWGRRAIPMIGCSVSAVFLILDAGTASAEAAVF